MKNLAICTLAAVALFGQPTLQRKNARHWKYPQPLYGRNGLYIYSVVVHAGQAVRPVIESASLDLEDTARQRLPQGIGVGLTLAPGQAPTEVTFRVAGVKP